jgi:hypothetical protein
MDYHEVNVGVFLVMLVGLPFWMSFAQKFFSNHLERPFGRYFPDFISVILYFIFVVMGWPLVVALFAL